MKSGFFVKTLGSIWIALMLATIANAANRSEIQMTGRSFFSFSPEAIIFQTQDYAYKINAHRISPTVRDDLNTAAIQGKTVQILVPQSALEFAWPTVGKSSADSHTALNLLSKELRSEAHLKDGFIFLTGASALSLSDRFALIQIGTSIYRLNKADLTSSQIDEVERAGPGDRLQIQVPLKALDLAWTMRREEQVPGRVGGTEDKVSMSSGDVFVRGTLLYSFRDPQVLVQSRNAIFQFKRFAVTTPHPGDLDHPGERIEVHAPVSAIEFVWPADGEHFESVPIVVPPTQ